MNEETVERNGVEQAKRASSTEVVVKAFRKKFSTAYIERILKELDEAPHGEGGKILRREGLYGKTVARC